MSNTTKNMVAPSKFDSAVHEASVAYVEAVIAAGDDPEALEAARLAHEAALVSLLLAE